MGSLLTRDYYKLFYPYLIRRKGHERETKEERERIASHGHAKGAPAPGLRRHHGDRNLSSSTVFGASSELGRGLHYEWIYRRARGSVSPNRAIAMTV
jgi:hypothetical protein